MAHYLDPKNDLTFKRVFGLHKHLCISLLNSMLPLDDSKRIVEIEYQTGELIPEIEILRNSIVDVHCTDSDGRQFIVEMQMYWSESFKSRVLLNASKAYASQLNKSKVFKMLQPVYALCFVNDVFEKSEEMKSEYYHHYEIVNVRHTEKQIKGMEFVFVELKKFVTANRAERKLHELWLRFLTEIDENTDKAPDELLENDDTREALKYMEVGAYTKEQLFTYDKFRDGIITEQSAFYDARMEGMEEGMSEGIKKGIKKGKREGKREGKKEGIKEGKLEVAENLLKMGVSPEDIVKGTGLTSEEVFDLQNRNRQS